MDMERLHTLSPGTAMDTDRLCQTGATTVDHDQPLRLLHCRHDREWPCPIALVVALAGTVTEPSIWGRTVLQRTVFHGTKLAL